MYYLPAHTTSLLQPMDQAVIRGVIATNFCLKYCRWNKLDGASDTDRITASKVINIENVINSMAKAFEEIPDIFVKI